MSSHEEHVVSAAKAFADLKATQQVFIKTNLIRLIIVAADMLAQIDRGEDVRYQTKNDFSKLAHAINAQATELERTKICVNITKNG
jgi:hypothetical protein